MNLYINFKYIKNLNFYLFYIYIYWNLLTWLPFSLPIKYTHRLLYPAPRNLQTNPSPRPKPKLLKPTPNIFPIAAERERQTSFLVGLRRLTMDFIIGVAG